MLKYEKQLFFFFFLLTFITFNDYIYYLCLFKKIISYHRDLSVVPLSFNSSNTLVPSFNRLQLNTYPLPPSSPSSHPPCPSPSLASPQPGPHSPLHHSSSLSPPPTAHSTAASTLILFHCEEDLEEDYPADVPKVFPLCPHIVTMIFPFEI